MSRPRAFDRCTGRPTREHECRSRPQMEPGPSGDALPGRRRCRFPVREEHGPREAAEVWGGINVLIADARADVQARPWCPAVLPACAPDHLASVYGVPVVNERVDGIERAAESLPVFHHNQRTAGHGACERNRPVRRGMYWLTRADRQIDTAMARRELVRRRLPAALERVLCYWPRPSDHGRRLDRSPRNRGRVCMGRPRGGEASGNHQESKSPPRRIPVDSRLEQLR